jgi:hypothetical protein
MTDITGHVREYLDALEKDGAWVRFDGVTDSEVFFTVYCDEEKYIGVTRDMVKSDFDGFPVWILEHAEGSKSYVTARISRWNE